MRKWEPFTGLVMYLDLQEAFGWQFYKVRQERGESAGVCIAP